MLKDLDATIDVFSINTFISDSRSENINFSRNESMDLLRFLISSDYKFYSILATEVDINSFLSSKSSTIYFSVIRQSSECKWFTDKLLLYL